MTRWLHRNDLEALIPDFIMLAEAGLNRTLSICAMEQEDQLAMVMNSRFVAPPDMVKPIAVWLQTTSRTKLQAVLPENLVLQANSGAPAQWALDGTQLAFDRAADQAYPITLRYQKKFALSDAAPTNSLLSKYPDVYLYGALLEAAPYLRDAQRQAIWQQRMAGAVQDVRNAENALRATAALTAEIPAAMGGMNWRG